MTKKSLGRREREKKPLDQHVLFTQHQIEEAVLLYHVMEDQHGAMEAMRACMMNALAIAAKNMGVK